MINIITRFLIFFTITTFSFSIYEDEINDLFSQEVVEKSNKLIIEQEVKVETIDPIKLKDTYSRRAMQYFYAQLFRFNKNGEIVPYLLAEYKYNDNTELYCKLRDDIYFSNGDPITSEDVKSSIENFLKNGYMKYLYDSIKQVKVINNKEFLIILNYPNYDLKVELTNPLMSILKRKDGKILTSGPYSIERFDNRKLKLKKNEYYFEDDIPFEKVDIKGELNSYQRVINSLNIPNYYSYDLYQEDVDKAKKIGYLKDKEVSKDSIFDIISLIFGNEREYSLEEKKALESLLNRDATTIYPKDLFDIKVSALEKKYSKEEAVQLLKKSGIFNEKIKIMCLNTIHNRNYVQYVAYNLTESGLDVEVEIYNLEKFLTKLRTKDYNIALYNVTMNKAYPLTSLEKTIVGEIIAPELEDALLPFFQMYKNEKNKNNRARLIDKIFYLIYSSRYIIPIAHQQTYIIKNF